MHAFTDGAGREWRVELNVWAMERLRDGAGADLMELLDGGPLLERLMRDPVLLCRVLWTLCEEQAGERDVSAEAFGRALAGETIVEARKALVEEIVVFFHEAGPMIGRQAGRLREAQRKVVEATIGRLDGMDLDALIERALAEATAEAETDAGPAIEPAAPTPPGTSSGGSPESSASTPAP